MMDTNPPVSDKDTARNFVATVKAIGQQITLLIPPALVLVIVAFLANHPGDSTDEDHPTPQSAQPSQKLQNSQPDPLNTQSSSVGPGVANTVEKKPHWLKRLPGWLAFPVTWLFSQNVVNIVLWILVVFLLFYIVRRSTEPALVIVSFEVPDSLKTEISGDVFAKLLRDRLQFISENTLIVVNPADYHFAQTAVTTSTVAISSTASITSTTIFTPSTSPTTQDTSSITATASATNTIPMTPPVTLSTNKVSLPLQIQISSAGNQDDFQVSLQAELKNSELPLNLSSDLGHAVDTQKLPQTEYSLGSVIEAVQYLLNLSPPRITGEVIPINLATNDGEVAQREKGDPAQAYRVLVRLSGASTISETFTLSDIFNLQNPIDPATNAQSDFMLSVAEGLYRDIDPLALAVYYQNRQERQDEEMIQLVLSSAGLEPRYHDLFVFGLLAFHRADYQAAIDLFNTYIEENSHRWFAGVRQVKNQKLYILAHLFEAQSLMLDSAYAQEPCIKASQLMQSALDEGIADNRLNALIHNNTGVLLAGCVQDVSGSAGTSGQTYIEHSKTAVELDPLNIAYRNNLALALFASGEYTGAVDSFEIAVALAPSDAANLNNLGLSLISLGNYSQAQRALKKAVDLEPQNPIYLNSLASVNVMLGNKEQAIAYYTQACSLPKNPEEPTAAEINVNFLNETEEYEDSIHCRQQINDPIIAFIDPFEELCRFSPVACAPVQAQQWPYAFPDFSLPSNLIILPTPEPSK